jgi:hypothetical protein
MLHVGLALTSDHAIGFFFGGLTAVFTVLSYFYVPEVCRQFRLAGSSTIDTDLGITEQTKGRSSSELDELFERGISCRKFAQTKTAVQEAREQQGE